MTTGKWPRDHHHRKTARKQSAAPRPPREDDWSAKDWHGFYDERAAIAELDGLSRAAAEALAFRQCVQECLHKYPTFSAEYRCPICRGGSRSDNPLLACSLGGGLALLHRKCLPTWSASLISAAVTTLAEMGIRDTRARP